MPSHTALSKNESIRAPWLKRFQGTVKRRSAVRTDCVVRDDYAEHEDEQRADDGDRHVDREVRPLAVSKTSKPEPLNRAKRNIVRPIPKG